MTDHVSFGQIWVHVYLSQIWHSSQSLGNITNVSNCVLLPGEQIHTELMQITNSIVKEQYSRIF